MTSYFDDLTREVTELARTTASSAAFVVAVGALEARVCQEVSLVTGGREFPDDLRERIQTAIACCRVGFLGGLPPMDSAVHYLTATKSSLLLGELHSLFHAVASRRHMTRFGMLSDNPAGILRRRHVHDVHEDGP